jgi:hypothetical protein
VGEGVWDFVEWGFCTGWDEREKVDWGRRRERMNRDARDGQERSW